MNIYRKSSLKRSSFILLFAILLVFPLTSFAQQTYKIGVLAKRGALVCMKKWKPTADYITGVVPGKNFVIVPLDFDKIIPAIENKQVDFILANSAFYVELNKKYNVEAVASLINSRQREALSQFAGVIFTRADNDAINNLEDLKGKSFMAVKESSFGGWHMALRLLKENGIDPATDFSKLVFGGKHDNVLLAIRAGTFDAGTVRSDTYERMVAEGKLTAGSLKVIHPEQHENFPFVASTRLYPEWPMAKLASTPDDVAEELANALIGMASTSEAAQAAKCVGWSKSLDYSSVDECLKIIELGPYKK